jgi:hypothetical protein
LFSYRERNATLAPSGHAVPYRVPTDGAGGEASPIASAVVVSMRIWPHIGITSVVLG